VRKDAEAEGVAGWLRSAAKLQKAERFAMRAPPQNGAQPKTLASPRLDGVSRLLSAAGWSGEYFYLSAFPDREGQQAYLGLWEAMLDSTRDFHPRAL
jgi:hypothetical protein